MAYVYLDDGFSDHPKIVGLSDAAFRVHIRALCYSNRHLTDGYIPDDILATWCRQGWGQRHARALTEAGLWFRHGEHGWAIHDYLDYQKSAGQVRKLRAQATERKRRQRKDVTP